MNKAEKRKLVSVIVPTFNRKDKLVHVLDSLFEQELDGLDLEVIIVDDGSSDGTEDVLRDFMILEPRIRYFKQSNQGPSAARNLGIREALGDFAAFTDDDCLVPKNWLKMMMDGFTRYPQAVGVGGRMEPDENVWRENVWARHELWLTRVNYGLTPETPEFLEGVDSPIGATNNICYRRDELIEAGGFNERFGKHIPGEEHDLKCRLLSLSRGQLLYLPMKVIHTRDYTLKNFLLQSYTEGIGWRAAIRRSGRFIDLKFVAGHMLKTLSSFGMDIWKKRDRKLVLVKALNHVIALMGYIFLDGPLKFYGIRT